MQEGSSNPKPPQRFAKEAFLHWAAKLARSGGQVYAVYEACGFWVFFAAATERSGDPLLRGLSAKARRAKQAGKDRLTGCAGTVLEIGSFPPRQPPCPGVGACAQRRRGTGPGVASTTRAVGQSAQGTGSAGAQFNSQSWD